MEFVVTSLKEEYEKDLQKAIINALRNDTTLYIREEKENGDMFYSEIYADYRDEFSERQIVEIVDHNCPMEAFDDAIWSAYDETQIEMENEVIKMCAEDEEVQRLCELLKADDIEDYIRDYVREVWYVTYPDDHFLKQEVKVNIMLDTGNGNYDFTHDNVLNYAGQYSNGEFEETSSILWLAKQQGKETETRETVKRYFDTPAWVEVDGKAERNTFDCDDKFVASIIQELENLPSHMGTLTFIVTMTLKELIELHEAIKEEPCESKYDPRNNSGNGYIVISKDSMCGLFDKWNGGGSVLEIELDKDVVLPIKYIFQAKPECNGGSWNYGVNEVYGLVGSAWNGTVKEIHKNEKGE